MERVKVRGHYTDWKAKTNTGACGYYRVQVPCRANGWDYVGPPPLSVELRKERYYDWLFKDADVLLTQFVAPKGAVFNFLDFCQKNDRLFVLDLDDNYFDIHELNPAAEKLGEGSEGIQLLKWLLAECDGLIVTRPYLETVYRPHLKDRPIFVLPNCIEPQMYPPDLASCRPVSSRRKEGQIRIGWAGGFSHEPDFQQVSEAMIAVCRRHPNVTFVCAGYESFGLQFQVPHYQWEFLGGATPHYNYTRLLREMDADIVIAPLLEHGFNRSKSAIRVLENGMLAQAMIASKGFDLPYQQIIKHGQNGLLATSRDEWEEALELLIQSPDTRRAYGENLRKTVIEDWTIEKHASKWQDAMQTVAERSFEPTAEALVEGTL